LLLDPPARRALRAAAGGPVEAVWVEVSLHAAEQSTLPLRSRRLPLRTVLGGSTVDDGAGEMMLDLR